LRYAYPDASGRSYRKSWTILKGLAKEEGFDEAVGFPWHVRVEEIESE